MVFRSDHSAQPQHGPQAWQRIYGKRCLDVKYWSTLEAKGKKYTASLVRACLSESRTAQGADADAARVRALAACKDFLTLWKDPDIPILKQAKAEYAKLQ